MRKRIAIGGLAGVVVAVALLLSGVRGGASGSPTAAHAPDAARLLGGFAAGDTTGLVRQLQSNARSRPDDAKTIALLGLAYQQRARETGDPAYYGKSEAALRRSLHVDPSNLLATSGLGSLALSRHRFREALALGRRARRLSPTTARSYGVIGDALVELGRYDEAFAAFNRMNDLRPSLSAYARISYARELLGDFRGAAEAMQLALDAAIAQPEALAWGHFQLGKLYWAHGEVAVAEREYRAALEAFPGYVYAYDALALVAAARDRLPKAIELERRAADTIPLPQFVTTLRDLDSVSGRAADARRQDGLLRVIRRLLAANGVRTDLETALFDADHARDPRATLALARLARRDRPSIDGDDVLAWALERAGRCGEARESSVRALRLGTQDALKFFHRGMIERCLGHLEAARSWFRRALSLNPHFSLLWAPVARRYSR